MSDENIIDVDQNETDTCEEITDTDTISGEDKSENISTNEAAGTTEDIDAGYSIDEEPGESSEDTSCSEANEATTVSGATASQVAETGGSKRWNEYTSSTDLDDTDELMILDTSAKANKRTLLSKLADYVLGKLADKVFAKLETQNQTVIGALNELNSKQIRTKNITEIFYFDITVTTGSPYGDFAFYFDGFEYNNDPAISINPIDGVSFVINSFLINNTTGKNNGVRLQARKNGTWLVGTKLSVTGTVIGQ